MGRYNRFSFTFEMIAFAIDLASYLPLMQAIGIAIAISQTLSH